MSGHVSHITDPVPEVHTCLTTRALMQGPTLCRRLSIHSFIHSFIHSLTHAYLNIQWPFPLHVHYMPTASPSLFPSVAPTLDSTCFFPPSLSFVSETVAFFPSILFIYKPRLSNCSLLCFAHFSRCPSRPSHHPLKLASH